MAAARFIIGLVFVLILGALSVWVFIAMNADEGRMISYALGNETEQTVEIHVEVTQMMSDTDTWAYANPESGQVRWPEWGGAHYVVTDPQGNQVEWTTDRRSNLVTEAQHRGFTVLFLKGTVNKGTPYTFSYIPIVGEPEEYRTSFTPTSENLGRQRVTFETVN